MPTVPYYQAVQRLFTAVMPPRARAAGAKPAAAGSPAGPKPAVGVRTQREAGSAAGATPSASAWEVWASQWFHPHRQAT